METTSGFGVLFFHHKQEITKLKTRKRFIAAWTKETLAVGTVCLIVLGYSICTVMPYQNIEGGQLSCTCTGVYQSLGFKVIKRLIHNFPAEITALHDVATHPTPGYIATIS